MIRRALVCGLAAGALLTACGGDPAEPRTLPSQSTSPSPSPSPSPSSSALPQLSREEAERFVRAYYSAVNAALATGLVGDLEHLSVEGCACRRLVGYIREKWTAGSIRGAKFTVTSVAVLGVFPAVADVLVEVSVPAYDVLDRSGRVVERVPPDRVKETVKLAPNTDGRWLVVNIFGSSQ